MCFEVIRNRGDERGDAALHVGGAPAIKHAVFNFRCEGIVPPRRVIPRRHHIDVAGKTEIGARGAQSCVKIFDAVLSKRKRWQAKPSGFSAASTTPSAPASSGVTEGQRIKACASAIASEGVVMLTAI